MGYLLGVDLGTSFTAAALSRDDRLELVSLGTRSLEIPSVVYLDPDQGLLIGEAAERRGLTDPTRVAREFKRRLGDPAPILIAGTPFSAEGLMAAVLKNVIAEVTARQGEPPAHVTLTRPANWGPYKCELFDHVPVLADAGPFSTTTEPEAAAAHFASTTRVAPGGIVAVYDLGGGTFDAAVLRKTDDGFEILGVPEGIEHLGGADFDDAVFDHVRRVLGSTFTDLNPLDPTVRAAAARLRAECVQAKEGLSRDTETTIPVSLPGDPDRGPTHPPRVRGPDPALADGHRRIAAPRASLGPDHPRPGRRDRPRRRILPHPAGRRTDRQRTPAAGRGRHPPQTRRRARCRPHRHPRRRPPTPRPTHHRDGPHRHRRPPTSPPNTGTPTASKPSRRRRGRRPRPPTGGLTFDQPGSTPRRRKLAAPLFAGIAVAHRRRRRGDPGARSPLADRHGG